MNDYKLKYRIDGDASGLKREVGKADDLISKIGSSIAGVNPFTAMTAGAAALGAAAVSASVAVFELSRSAADFGSEIFDASQKTGLSAETLSSMKFAADQAGTSLDDVTSGAAKFAKVIGDAGNGSDEAQAKLDRLGVTSTDLDTALAQALETIAKMPPGTQQMNAAFDAFGKSGANLLPFIRSFDGDLVALTKKAKELGVTIDDDAAAAADEFGDQLDTLSAQFAGIGRTIGMEFLPIFLDMGNELSAFLTKNREDVAYWSGMLANSFRLAILGFKELIDFIRDHEAEIRIALAVGTLGSSEVALAGMKNILAAVDENYQRQKESQAGRPAAGGGSIYAFPADDDITDRRTSRRLRGVGRDTSARDAQRAAEQAERDRISLVKENAANEITEKQASVATLIQLERTRYAQGLIDESAYVRAIREQEMALSGFILNSKHIELEALKNNAAEKKRLESEIRVLNSQNEKQLAEFDEEDANRKKKNAAEAEREFEAYLRRIDEKIAKIREEGRAEAEAFEERRARARSEREAGMASSTAGWGSLGSSMGVSLAPMFDDATNAMLTFDERLLMVHDDIVSFQVDALGGMVEGLGQMAAAWLMTGEFSAKAAMQMLSSVAFSIASQAALKAVFEAAEAVAAAARFDMYAASMHATAASMYSSVAVVAGAAGVALALGSRAMGGGKGGGKSGRDGETEAIGATGASRREGTIDRDGQPLSSTPFSDRAVARAIEKLADKISGMRPGDVLTAGAREKKGFIGSQALDDQSKSPTLRRRALVMQRK